MRFKDEFKKEMDNISPDEDQCERIRDGVMRKLAEETPVKRKRPFYLKIAAVSGAAVCAAVIIIFGTRIFGAPKNNYLGAPTVNITDTAPGTNDPGDMINGAGKDDDHTGGAPVTSENGRDQGSTPTYGTSEGLTAPPASDNSLRLSFSEDKSVCKVTKNGETHTYRAEQNTQGDPSTVEAMEFAVSNLDVDIFVKFSENKMTVYYKDKSVLGVYITVDS